ncbi:hypothetical protein SAMN02910293_00849 [Streptococcus henryi]|uniref:Uncharacterized protein n=1 Tax=Streptococcus henryi TaxID=439219 RepID=A0A1G6B8U6_9STRE|nr:hypothetical protein SAMN02910293_00849 [Streptococcus henryi]
MVLKSLYIQEQDDSLNQAWTNIQDKYEQISIGQEDPSYFFETWKY